jgi:hypothetical protein
VGNCVVAGATASLTGGVGGLSWGFKFSGGGETGLVSEVSDLVGSEGSSFHLLQCIQHWKLSAESF